MKYSRHLQIYQFGFLLLLFVFISASCKKEKVNENNQYLVEWDQIATVSKEQVLFIASTYPEVYDLIETKELSNVKIYKLVYKTKNVSGEEIFVSGALAVPDVNYAVPLLSYQHGTLFSYDEAPSKFFTGEEVRGLAPILGSLGYIVSMPDYIGYGESEEYPHPYEHAKTLGSASFDMLMAAKEFLKNNNIATSDKLFLTGYSEGGNATMAMHKYIEENSTLIVTMSAPASGAYNKTAFAKYILQQNEDLSFLLRFMWVLDTYNWIYDLNRDWDQYVNEPYATTLNSITDPFTFNEASITHNPQTLFTPTIIQGVLNGSDTEFLAALADNDNFDWTPEYPITLYYGTADDYVFPLNSETAYDSLYSNGANVERVIFDGADHSTAFMPYLLSMFELFESLK